MRIRAISYDRDLKINSLRDGGLEVCVPETPKLPWVCVPEPVPRTFTDLSLEGLAKVNTLGG